MGFVTRITVKQQVYEEIKRRIQNLEYPAGERLVIDEITRELGVSNSPIREALNWLEKDGLVYSSPNLGSRVVNLTEKDITELDQAIYILISAGYDLCLQSNNIDILCGMLEYRLKEQERILGSHDDYDYIKSAILFDRSFLDAASNSQLIKMFDSFADIFFLNVAKMHRTDDPDHQQNLAEHKKILAAVKNNKVAAVKDLMISHYHIK